MFFFSALTVAAACASLAAARIGPARNVSAIIHDGLSTRQVDLPKDGCNSVGGLKWTDDTFDTVVRTWRDAFGGGGGSLNHGDGTTSTWQAVCCSQFCLDIRNDGGGTFSWSDADFERGVQKLKELKAGDGCTSANWMAATSAYGWLWISFASNDYQLNGPTCDGEYHHLVEAFGDTCSGAAPFNGPDC